MLSPAGELVAENLKWKGWPFGCKREHARIESRVPCQFKCLVNEHWVWTLRSTHISLEVKLLFPMISVETTNGGLFPSDEHTHTCSAPDDCCKHHIPAITPQTELSYLRSQQRSAAFWWRKFSVHLKVELWSLSSCVYELTFIVVRIAAEQFFNSLF